ncbi:MAG: tetratricopeptide repeat protein [Eubacterium sp.]|nr:tetratricopeptide repeat protein [Eubacterium sp.]
MAKTFDTFYRELDALYDQGDLQRVERYLQEQREQYVQEYPRYFKELVAVCNEMGSFYRGTSRYDRSAEAFQSALGYIEEDMGKNCIQYATVLNNMAGTYRLTGDYQKAITLFLEARDIYLAQGQKDSYEYASVLNNISQAYLETRTYDQAIAYLKEALALVRRISGSHQDIAITYNNLAALYRAAGDHDEAKRCAKEAIREFEQCADEENVHYAAGLNSLAGILYAEQQYEQALELYQKSAAYTKRFFGENIEYGVTCRNMYWVCEKLGRIEDAIAALEMAKENFTRLLGAEHDRTLAVADDLRRLRGKL